jgi:hypothetical protein
MIEDYRSSGVGTEPQGEHTPVGYMLTMYSDEQEVVLALHVDNLRPCPYY